MRKKWLLSLLLATLVLVVTACSGADESAEDNNSEPGTQEEAPTGESGDGAEQPEMPEPDLEGIPEVVAEVNGKEILRADFEVTYEGQFQQMAMMSQMTGEEIDQDQLKKQIAESMVGQELLIQEADSRDINVSEEDFNETLDRLASQNGLESKDEFLATLEEQGMGEEEVMSQLEPQVKVDLLIASESGDIAPTDEELQAAYDQMVAQQEQAGEDAKAPSFDEVKPDLEEEVKMQKESEAVQALVTKLREGADVTVNI